MIPKAKQWRAVRAFQNNGPDYWLIFEGKNTFGADPIASIPDEGNARAIVARHNDDSTPTEALFLVEAYARERGAIGAFCEVSVKVYGRSQAHALEVFSHSYEYNHITAIWRKEEKSC